MGGAWNRAIETGFAAADPYDGPPPGKVDLWAFDDYHGSTFGDYLEALMIFGQVTGKDPLSLGPHETAASERRLAGASPGHAADRP